MKQNKTILIVTPSYPPEISGAATYFSNLVKYLPDEIKVIVLTTKMKGKSRLEKKDGVSIYRVIPNLIFSNSILRVGILPTFTFFKLLFLFFKQRFSLMHVHSSTAITLGAALFSLISRLPVIYEVQDLMFFSQVLKLGNIKKYIATGQIVKRRLEQTGIYGDKIKVINSIPPRECQQIKVKKPKNGIRLIYVGKIDFSRKGVEMLLGVFNEIIFARKDCHLTLVGDGPDFEKAKRYIEKNKLSKNVYLTGAQGQEETLKNVAFSDILILPSKNEAIPRVILEAYALKKPVIATKVGGIPEVVMHEETGLLIEFNKKELKNAITYFLENESKIKSMGEKGFQFQKKLPSWQELAKNISELYLE